MMHTVTSEPRGRESACRSHASAFLLPSPYPAFYTRSEACASARRTSRNICARAHVSMCARILYHATLGICPVCCLGGPSACRKRIACERAPGGAADRRMHNSSTFLLLGASSLHIHPANYTCYMHRPQPNISIPAQTTTQLQTTRSFFARVQRGYLFYFSGSSI